MVTFLETDTWVRVLNQVEITQHFQHGQAKFLGNTYYNTDGNLENLRAHRIYRAGQVTR